MGAASCTSAAGGSVTDCSGDDSVAIVFVFVGFRASSSSPPSSSASLELSELSDSSCIASLILSRTSTVARADATGRALRPLMTT